VSGGTRPRLKGDAFEVAVLKDQQSKGRYCRRLRQGGGEPVDLISLEPCRDCTENKSCSLGRGVYHLYMIQCKARTTGKRADPLNLMSPAEREALITEAQKWGAVAVLAYKENGTIALQGGEVMLKISCDAENCNAIEDIESMGAPIKLPDGWILVIDEGEESHFHSWQCLRDQSKEWTEDA